jgi:hypothetical protein
MSVQNKKAPAAKPAAAPKPPKKLVPRNAPKAEVKAAVAETAPIAAPAAKVVVPSATTAAVAKPVAASPAAAKPKAARKPTKVDETVAKNQKVLADALVKAQAIKYDTPKVMKQVASPTKKAEKPAKAKKIKLVRDSYAMPEAEYARIGELKKRMSALGNEVKKSELLRGGIAALAALNDAELKAVMGRVERIKTGRPAK